MADDRSPTSTSTTAPPRFDARRASPAQLQQHLQQLGITPDPSFPVPGPTGSDDPQGDRIHRRELQRILNRDARQQARADQAAQTARAAELGATRIDMRTASADSARARLRQLGIDTTRATILDPTPLQPIVRPSAADPTSVANRIERAARELLEYARDGGRVDVRKIPDPQVVARYMQLRFGGVSGQWG